MSKILLITKREYLTRIRRRSFILMTILSPFLLVLMVILPTIFFNNSISENSDILVIGDDEGFYTKTLNEYSEFNFINATDSFFQNTNKETQIFATISLPDDLTKKPEDVNIFSASEIPQILRNYINMQLSKAATEKALSTKFSSIEHYNKYKIKVEPKYTLYDNIENQDSSAFIFILFLTFLIYIFIFSYGTLIMRSITEEKSNKVLEVMFLSVKPKYFILGKIVGVGLVGLTQFILWGIIISILFNVFDGYISFSIQSISLFRITIFFVIFFILGYFLYASIFAIIGAISQPGTETHQFLIPVTLPILFALYAGLYTVYNPDSYVSIYCSYIPFTSPIVMMVRVFFGVNLGETILSIIILLNTIIISFYIATKIYSNAILRKGR